jgi:lipid II:glycine glycyltransferase (peptidoglycan interpeptide bridge formation enzyme)
MLSDLNIINPLDLQNWDELILQHPDYSFFHSSYWSKVLQDTYNYKPYYFVIEKENKLKAAIPVMFVESFITGKRAVSLPFSDYCQPLISKGINFIELFNEVLKLGKSKGLKYLELRGGNKYFPNVDGSTFDYNHNLDITLDEERLFENLNSNTKRNIKKAIREEVSVEISSSNSALEDFYLMNCITRKKHGLPPQPKKFFDNLFKHVLSQDNGFIATGKHNNVSIAGAVYLHIGNKVLYKFGASFMEYQNLRANNLVMWEAIKYYSAKGFKSFSFGRTEPDNEGLRKFKLGWGTTEEVLNTYRYNFTTNNFVSLKTKTSGLHNKFFNKAPLSALKIFGSIFYKHFG